MEATPDVDESTINGFYERNNLILKMHTLSGILLAFVSARFALVTKIKFSPFQSILMFQLKENRRFICRRNQIGS